MKGERIKVKNLEELEEKLKSEKKDNILVKLIFLNFIGVRILRDCLASDGIGIFLKVC